MAGIAALYLLGYLVLRSTHGRYEFNKATGERAAYSMFDANREMDVVLSYAYWPLVRTDALLTGRAYVLDKW